MSDLRQSITNIIDEATGLAICGNFGKEELVRLNNATIATFKKMLPEEKKVEDYSDEGWNDYRKEVLERLE